MRELNLFIKRLIDLFGSLIGSIIISPILIIIAFGKPPKNANKNLG